jgi:hypothetical protein
MLTASKILLESFKSSSKRFQFVFLGMHLGTSVVLSVSMLKQICLGSDRDGSSDTCQSFIQDFRRDDDRVRSLTSSLSSRSCLYVGLFPLFNISNLLVIINSSKHSPFLLVSLLPHCL